MPRSGSNSWFLAVSPINGYGICAKLASDKDIFAPRSAGYRVDGG
jgi:hypothetical protein